MHNFPTWTIFYVAKLAILVVFPLVWVAQGKPFTAEDFATLQTVFLLSLCLGLPLGIWADWMTRRAH